MTSTIHKIKPHYLIKLSLEGNKFRLSMRDAKEHIMVDMDEETYGYFTEQVRRMNHKLAMKKSYIKRRDK